MDGKEINKFHALQLFTDTFAAETVHLTNEQVGIYIRLLCFAWTKNAKPFTTESAFFPSGTAIISSLNLKEPNLDFSAFTNLIILFDLANPFSVLLPNVCFFAIINL